MVIFELNSWICSYEMVVVANFVLFLFGAEKLLEIVSSV